LRKITSNPTEEEAGEDATEAEAEEEDAAAAAGA
jgi:hypothetical protein